MPYLINKEHITISVNSEATGVWNKIQNWLIQRRAKNVEFWLVDFNEKEIKQKLGLEYDKKPIPKTKQLNIQLNNSQSPQLEEVSQDMFDDIYRLSSLTDWNELVKTHKKHELRWQSNILQYPILLIDSEANVDTFDSYDSVRHEFEGYSYELEDEQFIVDSNGNSRKLEFWNFGHPIGIVIPSNKCERLTSEEISKMTNNKINDWLKNTYNNR